MEKNGSTYKLFYFFLTFLVLVAIFYSGKYVPFISGASGILIPIPFFYFLTEIKALGSLISLLAASLFVFLITGSFEYSYMFLCFGIPPVVLAVCMLKNVGIEKTILYSFLTAVFFIASGIVAVIALQKSSHDALITKWIDEIMAVHEPLLDQLYSYDAGKLKNIIKNIFPAILGISAIILTFFNFLTANLILKRRGLNYSENFESFKIPEYSVWFFIVSLSLVLIKKNEILYLIGLNISLFLVVLYFFQGLSIINYFFINKKTPLFLKVAGYIIMAVEPVIALFVALIGLFDFRFDFRKSIKLNINTIEEEK